MNISELVISDGHIEALSIYGEGVYIDFVDWCDNKWKIKFEDVIAIEALCFIGEQLDSINVIDKTDFIDKAVESADESEGIWKSYNFNSAWSNEIILRLVAIECMVIENL